jgi:hypothetical protein
MLIPDLKPAYKNTSKRLIEVHSRLNILEIEIPYYEQTGRVGHGTSQVDQLVE